MHWLDCGDFWVRTLLQRGLAAIYLVAFVAAFQQFRPLLSDAGLLPVRLFLQRTTFWQAPSLFHAYYSDRCYLTLAGSGAGLALLGLLGGLDSASAGLSLGVWLSLWLFYLSIVNVGQRFYGFGWESMLVEAGFFVAFLGPGSSQPSWLPILALRWMLLRVELGAGLIKLRHDSCWRDLTCLYYHYETQPIPNPWSWHFHHLPRAFQRASVLGSHLIQVVVPFFLLAPQPLAALAGALLIGQQLWLIVSGNYVWLNWLTVVLGFSAWSGWGEAVGLPRPLWMDALLLALGLAVLILSKAPVQNLCSAKQLMNHSYNPLRLVNTYGAFGSVERERYEIILEGTVDPFPGPDTAWPEYEFWAKPGDPRRRPPQLSPYHLRLDWAIWFLPLQLGKAELAVRGQPERRLCWRYDRWFVRMLDKLLEGDVGIRSLLRVDPFPEQPPIFVRALIYHYRYSTPQERSQSGAWWVRTPVGVYLPPYALNPL